MLPEVDQQPLKNCTDSTSRGTLGIALPLMMPILVFHRPHRRCDRATVVCVKDSLSKGILSWYPLYVRRHHPNSSRRFRDPRVRQAFLVYIHAVSPQADIASSSLPTKHLEPASKMGTFTPLRDLQTLVLRRVGCTRICCLGLQGSTFYVTKKPCFMAMGWDDDHLQLPPCRMVRH